VPDHQAVLSGIESVIGKMLDPQRRMCLGKHAEPDLQQVRVDESDLRPIDKRRCKTELCVIVSIPVYNLLSSKSYP
jgi:hypothetical protein